MFPDDSTCGPLIKITRLYFVRTYHLVERLGIYPGQIPLLMVLYQEDGLSQKELVKRLSVKPSTVAVMIKRMERNGLVQRERDEDDQRVTRIRLTPVGRKTREQAAGIMQKLNGAMLEGFHQRSGFYCGGCSFKLSRTWKRRRLVLAAGKERHAMLKIFKYMKHSALSVVCILLLLFIQAMSDLSLPDYTSDIVNVGIQQGGISETAPEAIRKSQFDRLLLFMNEEEQTAARDAYRLAERESLSGDEYDKLVKKYPALADEALYLREVNSGNDLEQLNDWFAKPILAVYALTGSGEQADTVRAQIFHSWQRHDRRARRRRLPKSSFCFIVRDASGGPRPDGGAVQRSTTDLPETMVSQGAVLYVKEEYTAIGMDTNWLQTRYILLSGAKMLLVALVSMASAMAVTFLASRVAAALGRDLRRRVFSKVVSFSQAEFDRFSTSTLITRSTNDIQQIQMMMVMLLRIVFTPRSWAWAAC